MVYSMLILIFSIRCVFDIFFSVFDICCGIFAMERIDNESSAFRGSKGVNKESPLSL